MKKLTFPKRDLTNRVFERLSVLKFLEYVQDSKGRRHDLWLCLCSCGKERPVKGNLLVTNQTTSCGCKLKENYIKFGKISKVKNAKPYGIASFNLLFASYKQRSRSKNIDFELNEEQFRKLTSNNCYYCNRKPSNKFNIKHINGDYYYNGIDRKDNNIGYILNNCLSCCEICNKAKRDLPYEDYVLWIQDLLKFQIQNQ